VNGPRPDDLPADVLGLLAHERPIAPAPAAARARVAARLGLGPLVPVPRPRTFLGAAKVVVVAAAVAGGAVWYGMRPPPANLSSPAAAPTPPTAPVPVVVPVAPAVTAVPAGSTSRPAPETEIALLRRARRALAAGDAAQALATLERHRRRWPAGELLQEREVLTIQALVVTGARGEARQRADAFLLRFPSSTLAATVGQLRQGL
jgi:hypothetical protein